MDQNTLREAAELNKSVLLSGASYLQEFHNHHKAQTGDDRLSDDFLAGFQWAINELKTLANTQIR